MPHPPLPHLTAIRFYDCMDGVRGHYGIGFLRADVNWFWHSPSRTWSSAGTVYIGVEAAVKALREVRVLDTRVPQDRTGE